MPWNGQRRLGPGQVNPWLRYHRTATAAAAAAVLMLTLGLLLMCAHFEPGAAPQVASPGDRPADAGDYGTDIDVRVGGDLGSGAVSVDRPAPVGGDGPIAENPFVDAERHPISTFPLSVDTACYGDLHRALLEEKRLPSPDAVRVAELVNAFSYSYPQPTKDDLVSITVDLAECPWDTTHHLARVGLRGRADGAALEAGVQVAFNPRRVTAYRLIGYEGRRGRRTNASAGESLDGALTALYELVPTPAADEAEWLTVKMHYRDLEAAERLLTRSLAGPAARFAEAPADFRFAAAAAEFGLLLRDSAYKGRASFAAVRAAARGALGADPDGRRAEFLALVDAADRLTSERKVPRADAASS